MAMPLQTEVLIIGAGPAGTSLAIRLADSGWDCLLVDRFRFPRNKPCASCFSPNCFPLLEKLELAETVKTGQQVRFIDFQTPRSRQAFGTWKNPLGSLFHVFPRQVFDALMVEEARKRHVRVLEGVAVEGLIEEQGRVVGGRIRDREIRAQITVVAAGASSRFLPPAHRPRMRSYQSVVGWFEGFKNLDFETADWFVAPWLMGSGWMFPESADRANVGIMVHADLLKASRRSIRDLFRAYLETPYLRNRLRGARMTGRLLGHPIRYTLDPEGICGDGYLMAGEACLLTHPLTGEGISQAMRSAELAAGVLQTARQAEEYTREALLPYVDGIRSLFRKNFRKAGLFRWGLDRPAWMQAALDLARSHPGFRHRLERRLNRLVL